MKARLIDCCDSDALYGILTVEGVSFNEVQQKIYEIKSEFNANGYDDWCLDDIFEKFPKEWNWNFEDNVDDIIRI